MRSSAVALLCFLGSCTPIPGTSKTCPERCRADPFKSDCCVLCGIADCGETFGSRCSAANCAGCCRAADGTCDSAPGAMACGGASCSICGGDGGAPETRCTPGNCAGLRACGAELAGQPRLETCGADGGFDPIRFCPELCLAEGAGELLACASTIASQCADAGSSGLSVLTASCSTSVDAGLDLTCRAACDTVRTGCDQRCNPSGTSLESCMSCAAQCGLDWTRCSVSCRR